MPSATGVPWVDVALGIIAGAGGLGLLFVGFGFLIGQFRKGKTEGEIATLELADERRKLQDFKIEDLQAQLNDWKERFAKQVDESKARESDLATRIAALESENKILREVVPMAAIRELKEVLVLLPDQLTKSVLAALASPTEEEPGKNQ